MTWQPELDELRERERLARELGGADKVKRQHDAGKLTIRERIDGLVDGASFHEIGAIAGKAVYDGNNELKELVPSNCVFGRAQIDGRPVVVVGDDFTVRGGSADATIREKPLMAEQMAHDLMPANHPHHRGFWRRRLGQDDRDHRARQPAGPGQFGAALLLHDR